MLSRVNQARAVLSRTAEWNRRELESLSRETSAMLSRRKEHKSKLLHVENRLRERLDSEEVHVCSIVRDELNTGLESVVMQLGAMGKTQLAQNSLQLFNCCLGHTVREIENKVCERLKSVSVEVNVPESDPLTLSELVYVHQCATIQALIPEHNTAIGQDRIGTGLLGSAVDVLVGLAGRLVGMKQTRQVQNHAAPYIEAAHQDWDTVAPTVKQLTVEQFRARYDNVLKHLSQQLEDFEKAPPSSEELLTRRKLQERLQYFLDRLCSESQTP